MFLIFFFYKNIPCKSILRKGYFEKCYKEVLSIICDTLDEHKIWVCIDKTTDSGCQNVSNVIVRILQAESQEFVSSLHKLLFFTLI